ncbi:hypothetical protein FF100_22010 [Methylobacterium terricola]|uniref:F5/8 type C domain-containing protein n=1 Tax=Methylobacterium terricola TaxID=2583531 RepID=A0A5C4LG81_9HYPH|nr:discoidin domain-containing protein [Methylobacterium terricola]TNC10828.1 hypothetical protein FF100_22010 [Methylobacterium terricola]
MYVPINIPFVDILGNDDGIGLEIIDIAQPNQGSVEVDYEYKTVLYTPPTNPFGGDYRDSFLYTVKDSFGQTASSWCFIDVFKDTPPEPDLGDRWRIKINAATGPRAEIISPTPPATCSIQFANLYPTNYTDGNSGTSADTTGSTANTSGFTTDLYIEAPAYNFYKGFIFTGPAPWYVQYNFSADFQPRTSAIGSSKSLDGSNVYTEKGSELRRAPRQFDLQHYDATTDEWKTVWISPESTIASGYMLNSEHNTLWPNRINDEDFLSKPSRHYLIKITSGNAQDYAPQLYDPQTNQPVDTIDHEYYDGGYQDLRTVELQKIDLRTTPGISGALTGGATGFCTTAYDFVDPLNVFESVAGAPSTPTTPATARVVQVAVENDIYTGVKFANPPKAGNLLVNIYNHYINQVGVTSGWTLVNLIDARDQDGIGVAYRVVDANDATQTVFQGAQSYRAEGSSAIYELEGVSWADLDLSVLAVERVGPSVTQTLFPTFDSELVIGMVAQSGASSALPTITGATAGPTCTPDTSTDDDGIGTRAAATFYTTLSGSGSRTISATFGADATRATNLVILSFKTPGANSLPIGAHRFWRLSMLGNSAGYVAGGLGGLQMRASAGGPAVIPSATSESSYYAPQFSAANLIDNDPTTVWATANGGDYPVWVQYDYGSTPVQIDEIAITARDDQYYPQAPTTARFEFSDDGVNWGQAAAITCAAWTQGSTQTFFVGRATSTSTTSTSSTSTTSSYAGYRFQIIRNSNDTLNGFPYYLEYVFPTPVLIKEIALTATSNPDRMPRRFEVQKKDEATGWYETVYVQSTSTTNWSAGETRAFTFPAIREPAGLATAKTFARAALKTPATVSAPQTLSSVSVQALPPEPDPVEDRGDPDSYVTYCYSEGEEWWSIGKLGRTAGIPVLVNHDPILAGPDGSLYRHEVTGQTAFTSPGVGRIYATSGAITPGPDGSLVTVNGVIPDDESGYEATTWHFKTKINSNDVEQIKGPYNSRPDGIIDTRFTARQVEIQVEQAKDGRWTFGEPEFDIKQRGSRR